MDIYIDYETICVNCKQKGYSFGYSFKTIEYKGITVLDLPQRHLNGSLITFDYQNFPFLINCLVNAHETTEIANKPVFSMINAKKGSDNSITRFTYVFSPQNDPNYIKSGRNLEKPDPKLFMYVDTYLYRDAPYFFLFHSFRNQSQNPIENFNFNFLMDFDIYGQEAYKTDKTEYDPKQKLIFQYDHEKGSQQSVFAGICSLDQNPPNHFEGNNPEQLVIDKSHMQLRDNIEYGPDDCGVGLQWTIPVIYPGELQVFPIILVFGIGEKDFRANVAKAKEHLTKIAHSIYNSVNDKFRQIIDPKLEEMSFSMREWCKD